MELWSSQAASSSAAGHCWALGIGKKREKVVDAIAVGAAAMSWLLPLLQR
uniref:Uncharacterized protein n=1 Tax=Arundo donax TaxID=35708 RepID=A0A0A8Y097_ARUDO